MLKKILIVVLCVYGFAFACTSFGVITESGSVIGKNRDYLYGKQSFELVQPLKQFVAWYGNPYNHQNQFYALMSRNDVKFGVNQYGLSAIEEDPPYPKDFKLHRKYIQPYVGYAEGMILYGILQNFTTVEEIVPYIKDIFSTAAPNYYQISDTHTILTVEVAAGSTDKSLIRPYTYKIISKKGDYFAHANTYLSPQFESLNGFLTNKYSIDGSNNRLNDITRYIKSAHGDFSHAFNWYLDTHSNVDSPIDKNFCENTSIFRSDLQSLTSIKTDREYADVYGTVSSFMVEHKTGLSIVHVRLLESINTLKNGNQQITYKELTIPLNKLFTANKLDYSVHTFIRPAPVNGVCN